MDGQIFGLMSELHPFSFVPGQDNPDTKDSRIDRLMLPLRSQNPSFALESGGVLRDYKSQPLVPNTLWILENLLGKNLKSLGTNGT